MRTNREPITYFLLYFIEGYMHQISRCGGLQLKGLLERLDFAATGSHLTPTYALRNVVQKESYMYICRTAEKRIKSNLYFP